jgi:hypothetical protein
MRNISLALLVATAGAAGCGPDPSTTETVDTTRQAITGCEPAPYEVSVFIDDYYRGSCINLGLNEGFRGIHYGIGESVGFPNDSITSLKLGSGVFAMFFKDSSFRGQRFDAESSYFNVGGHFNDSFSSAVIQTWDRLCTDPAWRPGVGQVALYADSGYGNTCLVLAATDDIGYGPGGFYWGAPGLLHMTDMTSSIRVGPGTRVQVGSGGYSGSGEPQEEFDRDVFDLTGTIVGNDTIDYAHVWVP